MPEANLQLQIKLRFKRIVTSVVLPASWSSC